MRATRVFGDTKHIPSSAVRATFLEVQKAFRLMNATIARHHIEWFWQGLEVGFPLFLLQNDRDGLAYFGHDSASRHINTSGTDIQLSSNLIDGLLVDHRCPKGLPTGFNKLFANLFSRPYDEFVLVLLYLRSFGFPSTF